MSSPTTESRSARRGAVTRASVDVNHRFEVDAAMAILERSAVEAGVELVDADADADLALALGGDGTMLNALRARLGSTTPVFGFNFGRMGFLTSAEGSDLESVIPRVFAGEFRVAELATLHARFASDEETAVNDVVVTSSRVGRMAELRWEISGEELGEQPCDGLICATPAGSTAYNLSNGGPVMMWGIDAMAISFVAPHTLEARPVVVPRGYELHVENRTRGGSVTVLVDGRACEELEPGAAMSVELGEPKSLLAHLPEVSFFTRYHNVFS